MALTCCGLDDMKSNVQQLPIYSDWQPKVISANVICRSHIYYP